ncbi:MAG: hypothetical protein PHO41_00655, partial [Eubacteriales bacterium]|nr:hypothetical protein [Eubacteriales bacterium]
FIGVVISVFVYAAICIKKDAYISFMEKPRVYVVMFSILGGINAMIVLGSIASGAPFIKDGLLTFRAANLVCAILLLTLAVVLLIKSRKDDADEGEENTDLREKE